MSSSNSSAPRTYVAGIALAILASALPPVLLAQGAIPAPKQAGAPNARTPRAVPPVWASLAPLDITLSLDISQLRRDKGEDAPWRPASITVVNDTGGERKVELRVKTRGKWRLANCHFPPLRLDFASRAVRGTPLERLDRPKLVSYCKEGDRFEEYVLQEYQLYRVQALLTPHSHLVRLLRVSYTDSRSGRTIATRHAFLLEEPEAMAERLGLRLVEHKGATSEDLDPLASAILGVFEYMIGNTDWSIAYLHNIELLGRDGVHFPVAYDYDHSGAVNTVYARPDPQLSIRRVRERLFRGRCVPQPYFEQAFALFLARREAITALYADEIGRLLPPDVSKSTLEYFDSFYRTIADPRSAKREILDRCIPA